MLVRMGIVRRAGLAVVVSVIAAGVAVGSPVVMKDKGVGPIKQVKVGAVDPAMAKQGAQVFEQKCSACHKFDERYVGPPLKGVTQRRAPEWIMNMILNPQGMTAENETAKEMLGEYMTQMTFQNVSEPDARAVLEYFRQNDAGSASAGAAPVKGQAGGAKPAN